MELRNAWLMASTRCAQNILKPDEHRKFQAAPLRFLDDVGQIHHRAVFLQGHGDDVSGIIDVKILRAPAVML